MSDPNTTTISGGGAVPSSFSSGRSYALSGKIMLSSIVVLFAVVILMLCLHIYARWYLLRRNRLRRGNGRLLFFTSQNGLDLPHRGLDRAVLGSIPVFVYSDKSKAADGDEDSCGRVECAVCLCEFQEGERCRTLPNCKHGFHVECIDMWFDSHSTCPLCRSAVEPPPPPESIQVLSETTPGSSEQCESCRRDEGSTTLAASTNTATGGSSSSVPASSFGIRVELPVRRVDEEFKSPGGRMAAIKRILSMDLRGYRGGGSSSSGEVDVEKGEAAEERGAPPTPRPPR